MKVANNFIIKLLLLAFLVNVEISTKIKTSSKDISISQDYSSEHTPGVIKEMFKKVKKGDGKDSDIYFACLNLMTNAKNVESMRTFWEIVKKSQTAPQPKLIERLFFSTFVESTPEQVTIDGNSRDCSKSITEAMIVMSELENSQKQKELRDIVSPYFLRPNPYANGKKVITAFIGVHRDTVEGRELIPKLNSRK